MCVDELKELIGIGISLVVCYGVVEFDSVLG
jgi:hypothetical protein